MPAIGERQIYVWCDGSTDDRAWIVSLDSPDDEGVCVQTQALAVLFRRSDAVEVANREAALRGLSVVIESESCGVNLSSPLLQ